MVKITYSIHGDEDMELAGEEKQFEVNRDETSPFSSDFPEIVSEEDLEILGAIRDLLNTKKEDCNLPDDFRVYAWVSAIQDCDEWASIGDPCQWFVETNHLKVVNCDSSGWQPY